MSEGMLLVVWICKYLLVGICAVLYRLGGWINKAFRRFLMPSVYAGGCSLIALWKGNYSNWIWLSLPLLIGTLHIGYSNNQGQGWKKRLLIGVLLSLTFLNYALIFNKWILFGYHSVLCISASFIFGVFNPFGREAVSEEAMIATMSLIIPVMMV